MKEPNPLFEVSYLIGDPQLTYFWLGRTQLCFTKNPAKAIQFYDPTSAFTMRDYVFGRYPYRVIVWTRGPGFSYRTTYPQVSDIAQLVLA